MNPTKIRAGDIVVANGDIVRADRHGRLLRGEVARVTSVSMCGRWVSLSWDHRPWEASYCSDTPAEAVTPVRERGL